MWEEENEEEEGMQEELKHNVVITLDRLAFFSAWLN